LSRRETNYFYQPPFPIRIWLIPSNNKYIVTIVFIEEAVNLFYITVNDFRSYILHNLYVTSNPFVNQFYQSSYLQNLKPSIPVCRFQNRLPYTFLYFCIGTTFYTQFADVSNKKCVCVCGCIARVLLYISFYASKNWWIWWICQNYKCSLQTCPAIVLSLLYSIE
jgi:hypothetical protein